RRLIRAFAVLVGRFRRWLSLASRTAARRFALSFPKSRMASGAKIILKAISGYTIARTVTKSKPKLTRGPAIVDIFKLEDGNVVEWPPDTLARTRLQFCLQNRRDTYDARRVA